MALDPGAGRGPGAGAWVLGYGLLTITWVVGVAGVLSASRRVLPVPKGVSALWVAALTVLGGPGFALFLMVFAPPKVLMTSVAGALLYTVPASLVAAYVATSVSPPGR
jgi:hypothetical protein